MTTTTVHLPDELRQRAEFMAKTRGITLDELVCDSLRLSLRQVAETDPLFKTDPLFADQAVFRGACGGFGFRT